MNEHDLFDAITDTPDEMIEEARATKLKKRRSHWRTWAALAACVAVVIGAVYALYPAFDPNNASDDPAGPPLISGELTVDGTAAIQPLMAVAYPEDDQWNRREENPVADSFLEAVNAFSAQTAAPLLAEGSGNQNYSPLSLYYALALAATGAEGDTARQFYDLLGVANREELSTQCGNLYRRLYTDSENDRLAIANSLWMSKDVPFQTAFVQNAANQFYASAFPVDFSDPATDKAMGQWVADNTGGRLTPTFQSNPEQILSILNTVYFYDEWIDKFDEKDTKADTFHRANGSTVSANFMNRIGYMYFTKGDGFTRSSLGLKNGNSMVFVLPDKGRDPRELLATPEKTREVLTGKDNDYGEVTWKLPKFRFSASFNLEEPLKAWGLTRAFGSDADFAGMTRQKAFLTGIRQESTISVNEMGVEAAAYTYVGYGMGSPTVTGSADMTLDHPFLYAIVSREGLPLFVGVCDDPTAS